MAETEVKSIGGVPQDARYEAGPVLGRHSGRITWAATDCWTGEEVVLKSGPFEDVVREVDILLALPPGVGPRVRDVLWKGAGRLICALERLRGETLEDAADRVPEALLPLVVREFAQCLAHLHHAGFVHADISPRNLFLLDTAGAPAVRLLDFGLTRSRDTRVPVPDGGTVPFVAPEVLREWIVDARADQYGLGMVLKSLFPRLERDDRWTGILDRLCQARPGRRYPSVLALRDEIQSRFHLDPSPHRLPPLGGGPLRGREGLLETIKRRIHERPQARMLLRTRPGLGLSRFLQEAVLAAATGNGPPLRMVDVGDLLAEGRESRRIATLLENRMSAQESLLCGLPDPSRSLRWLPEELANRVRAVCAGDQWEPLALLPLNAAAFTEIVAGSLEFGGDLTEPLARRLLEESDGNLRRSAELFHEFVQGFGIESGQGWGIDANALEFEPQRRSPPTPPPASDPALEALRAVSPETRHALAMLARAGFSFSLTLAQDLLDRFDRRDQLKVLLDDGFLAPARNHRLAFATRDLWRACFEPADTARAAHPADTARELADPACEPHPAADESRQVDVWLNAHAPVEPEDVASALHAARRARRLDTPDIESRHLTAALEHAETARTWGAVPPLLAYPDQAPLRWTAAQALARLERLAERLPTDWDVERLALMAGIALPFGDRADAAALIDRACRSRRPRVRAEARTLRAEQALRQNDDAAFREHISELEQLARPDDAYAQGVLDHLMGSAARRAGDRAAAERHLAAAAERLKPIDPVRHVQSLQLLAIVRFAQDPSRGAAALEEALRANPGPESEAQLRANLSIMYSQMGRDTDAARCVEEGLERLRDRVSPGRLVNLRLQRAWSWAETDRVELALRDVTDLLQLSTVRRSLMLRVGARMLLGNCHLQLYSSNTALTESARAWIDVLENRLAGAASDCLTQLLDVVLDIGAWDLVRDFGRELLDAPKGMVPLSPFAAARLRAIRAQLERRPVAAAGLLEERLDEARRLSDLASGARYLHHAGLVQLQQAETIGDAEPARRAQELFEEALLRLGPEGRSYVRGRFWLALARARRRTGDDAGAEEALERAGGLARSSGSKGLLVDCLETGLRFSTDEGGPSTDEDRRQ